VFEGPLSELPVLIVDCQTTGATPALGSVLELGWCVSRGDGAEPHAEAHWISLPEGERVSAQVRALTGFDESVLPGALPPEEAWRRLRAALPAERAPTAIHFARFELTFLKDWSHRFEPSSGFPLEAVCVHAVACRLYPNLPRRNLRALAGFLGHGLHLERRALGHVLATAFIWRKLVQELEGHGVRDWTELSEWLARAEKPAAPRKRRYPIAPQSYRSLPDQAGVYRFLRSNGDVLYVGKATSLKKRVASHFTKQSGATERALEMLTQVSDIAFTPTSSALEAALLETQLIKELDPPYNVQLVRGDRGVWFTSPDLRSAAAEPDEAHPHGPLSSRYSARALGALQDLLTGTPVTASLRAASVGAPLRFAPEEPAFRAGLELFRAKHGGTNARRIALQLLLSAPEEPEADPSDDAPKVWDPTRVCRHLERASAQAYQVLRRAAWLCLLASSNVVYREPGGSTSRFLVVRGAELTLSGDCAPDTSLPPPSRASRRELQRAFDAARYDSLRILTTELKRILRDGGAVTVTLSGSRTLESDALARALRVV
jgi:DNA polymerase III subunit epsilon